jgi:hypothetical protein
MPGDLNNSAHFFLQPGVLENLACQSIQKILNFSFPENRVFFSALCVRLLASLGFRLPIPLTFVHRQEMVHIHFGFFLIFFN